MRGAFDEEIELKQQGSGNDAEFTLSVGMFLLLCVVLVVVCGACFGVGYLVGHRGAASPAALPAAGVPAVSQTYNSQNKPSATTQAPAPSTTAAPDASAPQAAASAEPHSAVPAPASQSQASGAEPSTAQSQVRPALPAPTAAVQPVYPSRPAAIGSQPQARATVVPQTGTLWVQVAAVSHVDDARVLTNALIKRGYAVTARRDADDLIHVRIGPFNSRGEANNWRLKLLNDGYNAEIQQQ